MIRLRSLFTPLVKISSVKTSPTASSTGELPTISTFISLWSLHETKHNTKIKTHNKDRKMRFLRIVFIHTSHLQQKYINIYFFQLDFVSKINCTKCPSTIMITQKKAKSTPKTTFRLSKTTQKAQLTECRT